MSVLNVQAGKPVAMVLGAAGFLGRQVCRELHGQGFAVRGLGHGDWRRDEWSTWGIDDFVAADIALDSLAAAAHGAEPLVYVNCAGGAAVGRSYAEPFDDFSRSVIATASLLEFVRRRRDPRARVVVASSGAVHGDCGESNASADTPRSPVSPYGVHKTMAEDLCEEYSRFFAVRSTVVRLFSVYGEGLRKQLLWDALTKFRRSEARFFGTGDEVRDWLHVEDAAVLLSRAATVDQPNFAVFNGGAEKAATREVLEALARLWDGSMSVQFTGESQPGSPRRLTADSTAAHSVLGWQPRIPLSRGLARYVQWFKKDALL